MSWWEFECWLKHIADGAIVRELRAEKAVEDERARIDKLPEDDRPAGVGPGDALPIDELNSWLGWDDEN